MSNYAQIYRRELRDVDFPVYRFALRLALVLASFADRWPRLTSFVLWIVSLWAVAYIFLNYRFTTYL